MTVGSTCPCSREAWSPAVMRAPSTDLQGPVGGTTEVGARAASPAPCPIVDMCGQLCAPQFSRPLLRLAFGQGAGSMGDAGQGDGEARVLPAWAPSSSGHLRVDVALVEGHRSRPRAFPRQLPLPPFPVGCLGSASFCMRLVPHPAEGPVVDNGPRWPGVRRHVPPGLTDVGNCQRNPIFLIPQTE